MARLFLLLIFLSVSNFNFAQKKLKFYGMVKVNDKMWVDDSEITNNEYRQFINSLPETEKKLYHPDSTVWLPDETLKSNYFWHPAFDDYPVVGISYNQVEAFCKWRTKYFLDHNQSVKVKFRLPTKKEWEQIARPVPKMAKPNKEKRREQLINVASANDSLGKNTSPRKEIIFAGGWDTVSGRTKRRRSKPHFNFNFHQSDLGLVAIDGTIYTNSVHYYQKDAKNIYGLSGNVAEMVSNEGVSLGGSWAHKADKCILGETQKYNKPEAWLGFRCVVEILD